MTGSNLTREELSRLEYLLPRLKYATTLIKILQWLDNFKEPDKKLAYDLLLALEYITFNELQYRFDDLLKETFKTIPKNEDVIILPYGKVGKSGSIITYLIRNTDAYKSRKGEEEKNVLLTHDLRFINFRKYNYKHIIFIDDFVGSGKTFCDHYKDETDVESWIKAKKIPKTYLLCSVIMSEAKAMIETRFNKEVTIKAEERNKIFDLTMSPLKAYKSLAAINTMAYKYGRSIRENPYGFGNAESLISFFHGTPNNTLPIIWSAKNNWTPLFPRKVDIKMDAVRKEKKEIAFMIGIYNRLAIDLYDKNKSIFIENYNGRKREIKYNTHEHFSVVGLIKLKKEGYDDVFICQLLGLTIHELDEIYQIAIKDKLVSKSKGLTIDGINFINEINKTVRKEEFKKETDKNLKIKVGYYIPKMFKGMT